jgi:hypothetical protein
MNALRIPVAGKALQHDAVLCDPAVEAERPGADRMQAELFPSCLGCLGRDHDARTVGELRQQLRRRRLQVELHGQPVDDVDAVDGADLAATHAALGIQVAHQFVFYSVGIELLAVLEPHAVTDADDEMRRILPFEPGRENGDDVQPGIDVEQLVAETGENDPADIG